MTKSAGPVPHPDGDEHKGAVEDDSPHPAGERAIPHGSMTGQLGHRNADEMINGNDSDYPEPGSSPEHSGQRSELELGMEPDRSAFGMTPEFDA